MTAVMMAVMTVVVAAVATAVATAVPELYRRAPAPPEPLWDYTRRGKITRKAPNGDLNIQKCMY
jgi:hypothetical protein